MEKVKLKERVTGNAKRATEIKSEPLNTQHESLQCHMCFITFTTSKSMDRHMKTSHQDLYKQRLEQTKTAFTCYSCEKFFFSSDELSLHQATHSTEEKAFRCPFCLKAFFKYTELTQHRRHECTEQRCPCLDCGALFPCAARLRTHRMTWHPQLPALPGAPKSSLTFKCFKCGSAFQKEDNFLKHQETHADRNCEVKKRGHNLEHELQLGEFDKKIKKEEGSEECKVEALQTHKKETHGMLPRTKCDETYAQPEQIDSQLSRAGNSEYTCPMCGNYFGNESALSIHQKSHTEEEERR
ncbi:uncharacterized protein KZ484_005698 [Pholidichthys leucotaenia]